MNLGQRDKPPLEETHRAYRRKYLARPMQKKATSRIVTIGGVAVVCFLLPYLFLYVDYFETGDYPVETRWAWFPLFSAMTAGLFGTFFSRLIFLQTHVGTWSVGAIKEAGHWSSIILRGLVGMFGALIVYYFLQSGLIKGNVFPNFSQLGLKLNPWPVENGVVGIHWKIFLPTEDLALLIVWCFLAGFSERLVPNILASAEKTLSDATQK